MATNPKVLDKRAEAEPFAESKRLVELAHEEKRALLTVSPADRKRRQQHFDDLKKRAGEQFQKELIDMIDEAAERMTAEQRDDASRKTRQIAARVRARSEKP